jgi:predicted branched-subunit amino acid permease
MGISRLLKWVTGGIEAFLGIPFLGGLIILGSGWAPLQFMFVLHLVTLIICMVQKERFYGSVLGLITSVVGFVPILGMIMHIVTALVLFVDAARGGRKKRNEHILDVK